MEEIKNETSIRVAGLQRSGNHPIINWVFSMCSGKVLFLNNIKPNKNPFSVLGGWESKNFCLKSFNLKNQVRELKKHYLIYSYEDFRLSKICSTNIQKYIGSSKKKFDILILRDPFNLLASRLKRDDASGGNYMFRHALIRKRYSALNLLRKKPKIIFLKSYAKQFIANQKNLINLWKEYAREFLDETKYFESKITINYNKWVSDEEYRRTVAKKLGLYYAEKTLDKVPWYGYGSSFDGEKNVKPVRAMKVLERWKHFKEDTFYKSLFQDNELISLSKKIFGEIPGTEFLYE